MENPFIGRRERFCEQIKGGVAVLNSGRIALCPGSHHEVFRANGNFYYLTGLDIPGIVAVICPEHEHPYSLFTPDPSERDLLDSPHLSAEELKEISGADAVFSRGVFGEKLLGYLEAKECLYYTLGMDVTLDELLLASLTHLRKKSPKRVPHAIWELADILEEMRIYKSPDEIEIMRKAAEITAEAYQQAYKTAKAGVYEYQIEALVNHLYRSHGAREAFPTIAGSGANATYLHYTKNCARMKQQDLLLLDSGAEYRYYCADVTRTWPISGKFTETQRRVYKAVLTTQKRQISQIAPGVSIVEWQKKAARQLASHMIEWGLLTEPLAKIMENSSYKKYYPHGLGHWLGLEVHDIGSFHYRGEPRTFQPGMVITVEPGIYIPAKDQQAAVEMRGIGIRIEDDVLVTETGHEVLTSCIAKEIDALESF